MTGARTPLVDGLLVVDKPAGMTSHDVVARLRTIFGQRRVGHAGTLDPDATGVLIVGLGRATRLLRFAGAGAKRYVGELVLGVETTTLDASGDVVAVHDMDVDRQRMADAAATLTGELEQVPPMVSAVKVGGRRLHALAREGTEVDRSPRAVTVSRFSVEATDDPTIWRYDVECSGGTYVRSLVDDLGRALGGGAHVQVLRRVASGRFDEQMAVPLDDVGPDDVLPPVHAVAHLDRVEVDDQLASRVGHGALLPTTLFAGAGPWAVVDRAARLLAVYERAGDRVKPAVVVHPDG